MLEVNRQNQGNESGVQRFKYRFYASSKWEECESLTVGRSFYTKFGDKEADQTWKKPKEIVDDEHFEECFKPYPWSKRVDILERGIVSEPDIEADPFWVKTNTFPITLCENVSVLEYDIVIRSKQKQSKLPSDAEITKLFKKLRISEWK